MSLRIHVDFNTMLQDPKDRVSINTILDKYLLDYLQPNLPVILYDADGMEVEGLAEYDEEFQRWFGVPDWSTRRDLPNP